MTSVARKAPCTQSDCSAVAKAKGLCTKHYAAARRGAIVVDGVTFAKCSVLECGKNSHASSLCMDHHYAANRESISARKQNHYLANKESVRAKHKEYYTKHPEVFRRADSKRRALRYTPFADSVTDQDILDLYGTNCHLCGGPIDLDAPRSPGAPGWERAFHKDHVVALVNGGTHTLDNLRPSHGLCNLIKGRS